jgi:hypothetical protein
VTSPQAALARFEHYSRAARSVQEGDEFDELVGSVLEERAALLAHFADLRPTVGQVGPMGRCHGWT